MDALSRVFQPRPPCSLRRSIPCPTRRSGWAAGVLLLAFANPATVFAAPKAPPTAWPPPPFAAWVAPETVYVRSQAKVPAALSGVLQMGDTVTVTECRPDCVAPRAWAILGSDGAVPLRTLRLPPVPKAAFDRSAQASYVWARVPGGKTPVYARPDVRSKVIRKEKAEYRVAFVPDEALLTSGWLQRPDGGYMRARHVRLFAPSRFAGVHEPTAPFAFVRRKVQLELDKVPGLTRAEQKALQAAAPRFQRYDRLPVLGSKPGKVRVEGGWLPRSLVRIVKAQARPREVGATDRWVHVDLHEQVLTAYEGDRLVFATLVSTGKEDRKATRSVPGVFQVYAKTVHSTMRGKPGDDYYAEEIPYVLHFDEGRALHGTYWHDHFGIQKSHGCINLSLADAQWLFEWAPTAVPPGWHSVLPVSARKPTLWVHVDKEAKGRPRPQLAAAEVAAPGPATPTLPRPDAQATAGVPGR